MGLKILSIETSCDDTGVSIIEDGKIIINLLYSQIKAFKKFTGVIPEVASRIHNEKIIDLLSIINNRYKYDFNKLDYIAVTQGPGLINTLQVGLITAKTLSMSLNKPLIGLNHLQGHIMSPFINKKLPNDFLNKRHLAILVSGGHTQLILIENNFKFKLIGETRDDTIGECYDKVGSLININYPAGKKIDQLANKGNAKYKFTVSNLENYEFSYSGLKSQLRRFVNENKFRKKDMAASFQKAAVEQIILQTKKYLNENKVDSIILAGGVSANSLLRKEIRNLHEVTYVSDLAFCQDNAAMMANLAHILVTNNLINIEKNYLLIDSFSRNKW